MSVLFNIDGISKAYKNNNVLEDISFSVSRGDITGLIGGNGAGKTTLMKIISGIISADSGNVVYENNEIKSKIGVIIEGPCVYNDMSAFENLKFYGRMFGDTDEEKYNKLLDMVKLKDAGSKKAGRFSLGMKQRLGVAIALMGDIELLILDEPFNGLDAQGIIDLENILTEINKTKGITILISSHIIGELTKICTGYIIMDNGRICGKYTHQELLEKSGGSENIEKVILQEMGGGVL